MRGWTRRDVLRTGLGAAAAGAAAAALGVDGLLALENGQRGEVAAGGPPPPPPLPPGGRERLRLDDDWRFALGHADDPAKDFGFGGQGAAFGKAGVLFQPSREEFDASGWRELELPHDWGVELPFVNDPLVKDIGYKPLGRTFPETSIGWYRRVLEIPASDQGRRLTLEFDGVFRDAIVAYNGQFLARNMSGYAPFRVDITDATNYGGRNVLVVRADATEHEGWFYEGAGIYRHVWLVKTAPVHLAHDGVFVAPELAGGVARVTVSTELENENDATAACRVVLAVQDANGQAVATSRSPSVSVPARTRLETRQTLSVRAPELWSPETPNLYRLVTTLETTGGGMVDRVATSFGIRSIRFDANQGFFLNGKHVELKGTCNHQDHAGVGAALPDRLQSYRIERLKAMGSNAYRTSHNPPTRELLDACDRLGMLVLDETRMFGSDAEALSQLERMVRRDRNHPSIFAWSIANEEFGLQGTDRGARAAGTMKRAVHRLDPTRPVTAAMDGQWGKGFSTVVDVQGFNYLRGPEDSFHVEHPAQPCMGTEVGSTVSTRGIYANDKEKGYVSAYDLNAPSWASSAEKWLSFYRARPWLAGGFVWTGFDYRGEPTPYDWPCINSHFGILDTCGFPKDNFWYYQARWGAEPVLHLFPHWNWAGREGQPIDVWVHSNLERVELLLNGRSLGVQAVPANGHAAWQVPYVPGVLEARGFPGATSSTPALVDRRETTGPAARIVLRPDRARIAADGRDVSVVEVSVVDASGRVVPTAADEVTFRVGGAGKLIGVGNGDPSSHESDKGSTRRAFNGLCCAIVQAGRQAGEILVEAGADGLAGARMTIEAEAGAEAEAERQG